jgi:hypothetical protein
MRFMVTERQNHVWNLGTVSARVSSLSFESWFVDSITPAAILELGTCCRIIANMRRELEEIVAMIQASAHARPTPMEFELAYQVRVAIDRIRFAIKHTEQFAPHTDQMREAGLQLLDALERLEGVDRQFQRRPRLAPASAETGAAQSELDRIHEANDRPHPLRPNGRAATER